MDACDLGGPGEVEASASQANSICHFPAAVDANAFRDFKPVPSISEITLAKPGSETKLYDVSSEHSRPITHQKEITKVEENEQTEMTSDYIFTSDTDYTSPSRSATKT